MNKTKLLEIAQALNLGTIDDERARTLLLGLLGVSTRTFPVYEKGRMVKWQDSDFWVVEDNGDYNVLIANTPDLNDPEYNDWWVDKAYVC